MATVLGYLRQYRRWNGEPGLSLDEQKALVRTMAAERGYGQGRQLPCRWSYVTEDPAGARAGWPALQTALQRAYEDYEADFMLVIPTLDGVQFNLPFLNLLIGSYGLVCVRSGYRPTTIMDVNDRLEWHQYPSRYGGWLLSNGEERSPFADLVEGVRKRAYRLSRSIAEGLKRATSRGVQLGGRRRGSYRLTRAEKSEGGQVSALRRKLAANDHYGDWLAEIVHWRKSGNSLQVIALKLVERRVLTPAGKPVGPTQIHRILKRQGVYPPDY